MTTIANFDITNDLKVEFLLPADDNSFIIGLSLIGGDDVLGGAGLTWQDLGCVISKLDTQLGGTVKDSLYFQPAPASAKVTIHSFNYDPSHNTAFRPGTRMRVRLVRDTIDELLFSGFIDSISGTYYQQGLNKLDVTAFDSFKRYVNSRITLDTESDYPDGYVTPFEQLDVIATELGTALHASSEETDGLLPTQYKTDVIANTGIYDALQVGLGLLWLDPETQEIVFRKRPDASILPDFQAGAGYFVIGESLLGGLDVLGSGDPVYTVGNQHDDRYHLCMSDIEAGSQLDRVVNSLRAELASDSATYVVIEDQDLIDLYGSFAIDERVNAYDEAELTRWANAVYELNPTKLVNAVETPTIDRLGTLTEAAFLQPGTLLGVHYVEDVVDIQDFYTITKVSHSIEPTNWFTTLELWKGV